MAVDTANKRISVLNLGTGDAMLTSEPNTSVDDEDRYSLGYIYAGITPLEPSVEENGLNSGGSQPHRIRRRIKNG